MTITHLKVLLNQDCDMMAVREIVEAYKGAQLDDENYIVYFNGSPTKATEIADELHYFKYSMRATNEVF